MPTKKQKDDIKREQGWGCKLCGNSIKNGGHIHHKDRNPSNNKSSNLIAVCAKCHRKITPARGASKPKKPFWW